MLEVPKVAGYDDMLPHQHFGVNQSEAAALASAT
jgi:hypothetical protein